MVDELIRKNNTAYIEGPEPLVQNSDMRLMIVVSSAVLDAGTFKWTYQLKPAYAAATTPFNATAKTGITTTQRGLSISEMGNTATRVCGGVLMANLPAGYMPVKLHDGCAVWCHGARDIKGNFYWAIVSPTQAIDGEC
ncbi:MAG: hypothetical protein ACK52I_20465 [Pseudomonadota bacterium]|jgi:hypothetical protein